MCKVLAGFVAALAIATLPRVSLASEEQKPPERPNPEMLLKRLDSNQDGKVTVDEIPEGAPEHFKTVLQGADKDDDKVITKEELVAAMKDIAQARPAPGMAGQDRPPEFALVRVRLVVHPTGPARPRPVGVVLVRLIGLESGMLVRVVAVHLASPVNGPIDLVAPVHPMSADRTLPVGVVPVPVGRLLIERGSVRVFAVPRVDVPKVDVARPGREAGAGTSSFCRASKTWIPPGPHGGPTPPFRSSASWQANTPAAGPEGRFSATGSG